MSFDLVGMRAALAWQAEQRPKTARAQRMERERGYHEGYAKACKDAVEMVDAILGDIGEPALPASDSLRTDIEASA